MKNGIIIALLAILASCGSSSVGTASSNQDQRALDSIYQLVSIPNLGIHVDQAFPTKMDPIMLSFGYGLNLKEKGLVSHLPYYGQAYSISNGARVSVLNFSAPVENYKVVRAKKKIEISFEARNGSERVSYRIELMSGGNAFIAVSSAYRSQISFLGTTNNE